METKEFIGREMIKFIQEGDLDGVLGLFAPEAQLTTTIYGTLSAAKFFRAFFSDTLKTKFDIVRIELLSIEGSDALILGVEYIWTLKDGQVVTVETTNTLHFDSYNKIIKLAARSKIRDIINSTQDPL